MLSTASTLMMTNKQYRPITILSTKYDGSLRESYTGHLLEQVGPLIRIQVSAGATTYRGSDRPEALLYDGIEMYFTDRWYNVWHFLTQGMDRYLWYANISTPATLDGDTLQWVDLDIDIACRLDGTIHSLDFDEFQEHRSEMHYPDDLVQQALYAHDEVLQLARSGAFPFNREAQLKHWKHHLD